MRLKLFIKLKSQIIVKENFTFDVSFFDKCIKEESCPMFPYCKMSNKQPQDFDPYRYSQLLFLQVFCSLFFFIEFTFPIIPSFVMLKLFQKQKVFSSTKLAELMRSKLRHNLDNVIHNFFFFLVIQNGTVVVVQMFKFYLSARQKKKNCF